MDVFEIRRRNYHYLFEQFKDSIWRVWPDQPNRGMLQKFAEKLGTTPKYLSHVNNDRRNIGGDFARQIEKALELPHGWMDVDHSASEPGNDSEKAFVEAALGLFRQNPAEAQSTLIRLFAEKVGAQKSH